MSRNVAGAQRSLRWSIGLGVWPGVDDAVRRPGRDDRDVHRSSIHRQRCEVPTGWVDQGTRGQRSWTALVEVKTGKNDLNAEQIVHYLDIAREQGFDTVITISHEVATTPGVHPVAVDKRKLKKVDLFHLSWSRIHTEALIEQTNQTVSDPDQAWILSEFVRYVENSKSGAWDFDDMGPEWVEVRNAAAQQTLRAADKVTLDVVARFDQLLAFSGMELSRQLGVNVQQRLTRKEQSGSPGTNPKSSRIVGEDRSVGRILGSAQRRNSNRLTGRPQGQSCRLHGRPLGAIGREVGNSHQLAASTTQGFP